MKKKQIKKSNSLVKSDPPVTWKTIRYLDDVINDTVHGSRGSGLHSDSHIRLHDHSNALDGSPIAVLGVPDLPTSKITSGVLNAARLGSMRSLASESVTRDRYKDNLGTDIFYNNTTERSIKSTTYTKLKEITLNECPDTTLKTYFGLKTDNIGVKVYGQVYRNGSPVGTEQSTTSTTYVYFTETITGWADGDKYQIYIKGQYTAAYVYTSNQEILCTFLAEPLAITSGY